MQHGKPGNSHGDGASQDNAVRAHHDQALAGGEKRVLCRTTEGRLYSYAKDEIGVVPASSHPAAASADYAGQHEAD
jgi:hypothetical protein